MAEKLMESMEREGERKKNQMKGEEEKGETTEKQS